MKKIYALAAAAFVALAASAQDGAPLYITGDAADFVNGTWNPAEPDEFVYADGKYTIELTDLVQFKISTACGDWDTFNSGALGCPNGYGDTPGVAVALESWGDNILCPWKGNYTVTVAGDLSTITLATDTPKPEDAGVIKLYLRGDMNSWGATEEWLMTALDEAQNVFKLTCSDDMVIVAGEAFKIADADWAIYNFGAFKAEGAEKADQYFLDAELPMTAGSNDNCQFEDGIEWNGVCYFEMSTATVCFSNDKDYECPFELNNDAVNTVDVESNGAATYYTLQGVRVANPENGLFIVVKDGKASKIVK